MVSAYTYQDNGLDSIPSQDRINISYQYGSGVNTASQTWPPDNFQNVLAIVWDRKMTRKETGHLPSSMLLREPLATSLHVKV